MRAAHARAGLVAAMSGRWDRWRQRLVAELRKPPWWHDRVLAGVYWRIEAKHAHERYARETGLRWLTLCREAQAAADSPLTKEPSHS
jgi:hypothetical protein